MAAPIVIVVIGLVLVLVGISALRASRSNVMPLFFRGIHQSVSRSIGIGILTVGVIALVGGLVLAITRL